MHPFLKKGERTREIMKKSQLLSSSDEEEYEYSRKACCWWRSAAKFEEYERLKHGLPNIANFTPRIRLFREMERLDLIAKEGLGDLRYKLQNYKAGDFWVPTGGLRKEQMEIPSQITILLVGFSASGKTSLVNLMYSVLGRTGLLHFPQSSSGSGKKYMEEHNVLRSMKSGFCVYNTRGFSYDKIGDALEELSSWMSDGVQHKQLCLRSGDAEALRSCSKFVVKRVNCGVVVVNIAEVHKSLKSGDSKPLDAIKQLFSSPALRICNDQNPILILTHGDLLTPEERIESRLKLCERLGISESNGVYDIVCLTEFGYLPEESDPISAYALAEAVYRALLISDGSHSPEKNYYDWTIFILSCLFSFLGYLFAFLAQICTALGNTNPMFKTR